MLYTVSYENSFSHKKEERAYQHELGRRLLCLAMEREYGVDASLLHISTAPGGKPFFEDHPARFNLSHCTGLVCCALNEEEIGVDAERIRPCHPALEKRICTPGELAFLDTAADRNLALISLWTLKESLMKLSGEGVSYGFQNAAFSFEDGRPVCSVPGVRIAQFFEVPGYVISVCGRGELPAELIQVDPGQLL